ncbi:tetratricopeptide repeat protein [Kitasatospora sp. NPDC101155]|uniref:tetratricopeptide repeat protein n=1 Tax=Kitasatospora sp. NPDC101155 TaxID=3364097 RepID=UPI003830477C
MSTSPDEGRSTPEWEFLAAFGGIDEDAVRSGRIRLSVGSALAAAVRALGTGVGLEDALSGVERQIALGATAQRLVFLRAVERFEADRDTTPTTLLSGLCDLHLHAFELERRLGRRERARQHLLRAVATGFSHALPKRHLVDLYVEFGEYRAAVDTLTKAVDDAGEDATRRAMALFQLGDDLAPLSAEQSTVCFERARERDREGVGGVLAEYRLRASDGAKPSEEVIADRLDRGLKRLLAGDRGVAIDLLVSVLAWRQYSPRAWFGLGMAYRAAAPGFLLPPETLSDAQRNDLLKAVEALRMAGDLEPTGPRPHYEIALLELVLGRPFAALPAMNRYRSLRPDDMTALAYTGLIHLWTGDFRAAVSATLEVLEQDRENVVAKHMLLTLWELKEGR